MPTEGRPENRVMAYVLVQWARRWIELLFRHLGSSDYIAGTLAMSFMGVARDGVGRAFAHAIEWISQRLWVTVRLEEKDAELVLAWLRERPEVDTSAQLALYSQRNTDDGKKRVYEYEPEIQVTTRVWCRGNGYGRGRSIWITRRDRGNGERRLAGASVCFFGRDKSMLEYILEAGREIQRRKREKYLTVVQVYDYGKDHGLNWLHPQDKDRKQPGRSISSVVLPRCSITGLDRADALLEDAREFLNSESWYTERGIPYRRGYLLHGVPGGGKSSLVQAVASELRLPIYMLQLSSEQMTDDTLNTLLQYGMHDPPTILLLEDVDLLHSAVLNRHRQDMEKEEQQSLRENQDAPQERKRRGRLTLSGLLNALDGPTATTGRLLFMTTNAKDRLDPALLRSGRIDYEIEFVHCEPEQLERLFTRFFSDYKAKPASAGLASSSTAPAAASSSKDGSGEGTDEASDARKGGPSSAPVPKDIQEVRAKELAKMAKSFATQVTASGLKLTSADVQCHLMKHKTDPEKAVGDLAVFLEDMDKKWGNKGDAADNSSESDKKKPAAAESAAAESAASESTAPEFTAASPANAKDPAEVNGAAPAGGK